MRDPLSFLRNPPWLQELAKPIAHYLHLPTLPLHIHELVLAFTLYQMTLVFIAPFISSILFPVTYKSLNPRTRFNWDVHVVSLVQSVLVCGVALWVAFADQERAAMDWKGRVWGYTGATGLVQALVVGYFLWDLFMCTWHYKMFGLGMLLHCLSALVVYSFGFRPLTNFYAPNFILYELSSPFLNIHWFCDKLSLTGSAIQLINGIILLSSFIFARLVQGTYSSVWCFIDLYKAMKLRDTHPNIPPLAPMIPLSAARVPEAAELVLFAPDHPDAPTWIVVTYLVCNVTMNTLNWYWCGKMISALRKRFDPPLGTRRKEKIIIKEMDKNGVVMEAQGVDVLAGADKLRGRKRVDLQQVEVVKKNGSEDLEDDTETEAAMLS